MKQDALKQPFFAKMLEEQRKPNPNEQSSIKPTLPFLDDAQTQKYPSDGDDDNWPEPK